MSRKKRFFKKGEILDLEIIEMAFGGKGIAKVNTEEGLFTVFVQNSIPGQKVKGIVVTSKPRYAECKLYDIIEASPEEVSIPYQSIPGAPYATLPIENQHAYKKNSAFELFKRIGHIENTDSLFDEFIASPLTWHYRNKMEYSFSAIRFDLVAKEMVDDFGFGFKRRGTWWAVENMDEDSGLFDAEVENELIKIREYLIGTGLPAWHPPRKEGFFRHLVVRKSFSTGKLLIGFVTSGYGLAEFNMKEFTDFLLGLWGDRIEGIIHVLNESVGDFASPSDGNTRLIHGSPKLVEELLGLQFEVSLQSFFQPNPKCAEKLYSKAIDYVMESQREDGIIMDLFCGTGTIAQLLARHTGKKVIGVDIVQEAIEDAKKNAERNGINDINFYAADAGKFLKEFPDYKGKIACVVMDPPRAGIAPKTLDKVIELEADSIVYVSCNPATQARDAHALHQAGYKLQKFSLVDQFPHTSHLESVMLFKRLVG